MSFQKPNEINVTPLAFELIWTAMTIEFKSKALFAAPATLKIFFKIFFVLEYGFSMIAPAEDVIEHLWEHYSRYPGHIETAFFLLLSDVRFSDQQ